METFTRFLIALGMLIPIVVAVSFVASQLALLF